MAKVNGDIPCMVFVVLKSPANPAKGGLATYAAFETERHARMFANELGCTYLGAYEAR